MNNFEKPNSKEETLFKSDPNSSIIDQLISFQPNKSTDFTALKFLVNANDIKRYYKEAVDAIRLDQPNNPLPEKAVIGGLDHISRYGEDYQDGWERFKRVLEL